MEILKTLLAFVYSAICAYTDLKYRRINLKISFIIALIGVILIFFTVQLVTDKEDGDIFSIFISFIPGIILSVIAFLSGGGIGIGDAIFILISGLYFSLSEVIAILTLTWLITAIFAVFLIVTTKEGRKSLKKKEIPFISVAFPIISIVLISRYI